MVNLQSYKITDMMMKFLLFYYIPTNASYDCLMRLKPSSCASQPDLEATFDPFLKCEAWDVPMARDMSTATVQGC